MTFVLAVLLASNLQLQEVRAVLKERLQNISSSLVAMKQVIENPAADINAPDSGLVLWSPNTPDENKHYTVLIVAVLGDSSADKAGIQPGDRLLAIGDRKLDYETEVVAKNLLQGSGPIRLTVQHGSTITEHSIERQTMPCITRTYAIHGEKILGDLDFMTRVHDTLLERLNATGDDVITLSRIGKDMAELENLAAQLSVNAMLNFQTILSSECRIKYAHDPD